MAECGANDRLFIGLWLLVLAGMVVQAAGSWWLIKLAYNIFKEKLCQKTGKNKTDSVSGVS